LTKRALEQRIQQAIERVDERALIDVLVEVVRIPSVFDPAKVDGNERAVADRIAALLELWGLPYKRWEVVPGRPNIVADLRGGDGPVLVFEGHMDVVTPGDPAAWNVDPFGGLIEDGKLHGRGAADMKGGLVAMLFAARAIQLAGVGLPGALRLAVLSDEEGMMQGARAFVEQGYLDGVSAAIICEPEGGRVCIAQKGALRIAVGFEGVMAHGCMPDEGANPLMALGEAIVTLRALESEIQAEREPHPLLGSFHLTPTVACGGLPEQANVIPSQASLYLDVRTGPEHDHAEVVERIGRACRDAACNVDGVCLTLNVVDDRPATETPQHDPVVAAAIQAHEQVFGCRPPLGGVPGSTDGTIFWMARRTPLVTWGPGDTTIPHQTNEFVHLDEVCGYARAYAAAALRYFDIVESS
jgi:succinyl-diaminopimelate desuccinylase